MDGNSGKIVDMKSYGLYESASVKVSPSFPFRPALELARTRTRLLHEDVEALLLRTTRSLVHRFLSPFLDTSEPTVLLTHFLLDPNLQNRHRSLAYASPRRRCRPGYS